jgi:hypothetical protein
VARWEPVAELDTRFSSEDASATPWAEAREVLEGADVYWLSTVRADGRPHVTTGSSRLDQGLDVVVEGDAVPVTEDARLHQLAGAWEAKYGPDWRFEVREGRFSQEGIPDGALVYEVAPVKAFGFAKGAPFGQTRWRF